MEKGWCLSDITLFEFKNAIFRLKLYFCLIFILFLRVSNIFLFFANYFIRYHINTAFQL